MNYLAHIYLSGDDPLVMIGNLIGDMVRNPDLERLSEGVKAGVALHRFIDSYTDNHPDVRKLNAIFRPTQRKYAPVISDIILDHVLARRWDDWSEFSFASWCDQTYQLIDEHYQQIPFHARKRVASMVDGRWLDTYGSEKGVRYALSRLSTRARFDNRIEQAYDVYEMKQTEIESLFESFFPDIKSASAGFVRQNEQDLMD